MQAAPSWASLLESDSEAPRGRREPGIGPWARSTRRRRRAKRMLETFFADLDLASQALLLFWSGNAVKAQVPNELGNRCARCTVPYHAAAPATSAHASAMLLRRPPRCAWGAPVHVSRPLNVQQEFGLPRVCPCAILYHPGPRTRIRQAVDRKLRASWSAGWGVDHHCTLGVDARPPWRWPMVSRFQPSAGLAQNVPWGRARYAEGLYNVGRWHAEARKLA